MVIKFFYNKLIYLSYSHTHKQKPKKCQKLFNINNSLFQYSQKVVKWKFRIKNAYNHWSVCKTEILNSYTHSLTYILQICLYVFVIMMFFNSCLFGVVIFACFLLICPYCCSILSLLCSPFYPLNLLVFFYINFCVQFIFPYKIYIFLYTNCFWVSQCLVIIWLTVVM